MIHKLGNLQYARLIKRTFNIICQESRLSLIMHYLVKRIAHFSLFPVVGWCIGVQHSRNNMNNIKRKRIAKQSYMQNENNLITVVGEAGKLEDNYIM